MNILWQGIVLWAGPVWWPNSAMKDTIKAAHSDAGLFAWDLASDHEEREQ